jgi:hypothetical protein
MNGEYEKIENEPDPRPHRCQTPGWFRRWRDGVGFGTIWRCECGRRFEWGIASMRWPYPMWKAYLIPANEALGLIAAAEARLRSEKLGQHPGEIGLTWSRPRSEK